MTSIVDVMNTLNSFIWGPYMIVFLIGTGIWLTIATGVVQVRMFGHAWKLTFASALGRDTGGEKGDITPYQALMTALSATVGNGNIAGVATAIALGDRARPYGCG